MTSRIKMIVFICFFMLGFSCSNHIKRAQQLTFYQQHFPEIDYSKNCPLNPNSRSNLPLNRYLLDQDFLYDLDEELLLNGDIKTIHYSEIRFDDKNLTGIPLEKSEDDFKNYKKKPLYNIYYGINNFRIKFEQLKDNGTIWLLTSYKYNDYGQLEKKADVWYDNPEYNSIISINYDGLKITSNIEFINGKSKIINIYTKKMLRDNTSEILMSRCMNNKTCCDPTSCFVIDSFGHILKQTMYLKWCKHLRNRIDTQITVYHYGSSNQKTRIEKIGHNGRLDETTVLLYNENHCVQRRYSYTIDSSFIQIQNYKYAFDEYRNWTRKLVVDSLLSKNNEPQVKQWLILRDIKYFKSIEK